jgi:hypothetical protein
MTLGLALVLLGLLLMYCGFKGYSLREGLLGRHVQSKKPAPVEREQG